MSTELVLILLRMLIALALYGFLAALLYTIWRDIQTSDVEATASTVAGRLIVAAGEDEVPLARGSEFPLRAVTTLGRAPTNIVVLPDSAASSEHARLTLRRGQWWLEDLDSRNGTRLNGVRIEDAVVLADGDMIKIGRIEFRLRID